MSMQGNRNAVRKPVLGRFPVWLVAVAALALIGRAHAVVISFETSEGFPDPDGALFTGTATPTGVVDNWGVDTVTELRIDHGPGGTGFGNEPAPLTGTQVALANNTLNSGGNVVTVDLNDAAKLTLVSFWYANRGSFPPTLEVDYYNLSGVLVGTDTYTSGVDGGVGVGLDAVFEPKFQLITPSTAFAQLELSQFVIRSLAPSPAGHGAFILEDITLIGVPEPSALALAFAGAPWLWRRWRLRK